MKEPKTLDNLFKIIEDAKEELDFNNWEECFYRGDSKATYDLMPSLMRFNLTEEDLLWTETSLFYEFSTRAKLLHNSIVDDWDILAYMRHHTIPTRLIDWTETLGVALYFATLKIHENTPPCIWLLNPYKLNELTWEARDLISPRFLLNPYKNENWSYSDFLEDPKVFNIKNPVAIYPPQKSDRMLAQRGWFTFHGTNVTPINEIPKLKDCYRKIIIPKHLVVPIGEFLFKAGINDYTMFPDLDGLAQYLKQKYKLNNRV
jgi:hypothetical protein